MRQDDTKTIYTRSTTEDHQKTCFKIDVHYNDLSIS